jgi:hypothetical protein
VVLGVWIGAELLLQRRAVPPPNVRTFDGFLAWRPRTEFFRVHQIRGNEFLEALGPGAGILLPSGPAGYVFDRSGRMIDWTHDSGDDRRFEAKWRESYPRRGIDRQRAAEWMNRQEVAE